MKDIIHSDWFVLSGYAIGVLGLILSYIFFKKAKVEKRPCCINRSNNLIYKAYSRLSDLKIAAKYKGVDVETLSYTKVAFWNAGKATITNADLSGVDPLRIEIENEVVYDCEILYTSQKANGFNINWVKDDKTVYLKFDYLDFGQGAVIKIIHSGNTVSYTSSAIKIKGAIKGATKIESPHPSFAPTSFLMDSKVFYEDSILI